MLGTQSSCMLQSLLSPRPVCLHHFVTLLRLVHLGMYTIVGRTKSLETKQKGVQGALWLYPPGQRQAVYTGASGHGEVHVVQSTCLHSTPQTCMHQHHCTVWHPAHRLHRKIYLPINEPKLPLAIPPALSSSPRIGHRLLELPVGTAIHSNRA